MKRREVNTWTLVAKLACGRTGDRSRFNTDTTFQQLFLKNTFNKFIKNKHVMLVIIKHPGKCEFSYIICSFL